MSGQSWRIADYEVDLSSRALGATVVAASDEAFGEKENLLNAEAVSFEPGHYGPRGEVVDGWETRRRRKSGHDWVIIRLAPPGRILRVDVDTTSFSGNFPPQCQLEACGLEGYPGADALTDDAVRWHKIVPCSPLRGDAHNLFQVDDPHRFTHVRLSVFPDGGVARLRINGEAIPDPRHVDRVSIDLAGQEHGGLVVDSSDGFYGSASAINRPGEARTMGEGWETKRRRDAGHDWALVRLGYPGVIRQAIVDTRNFRYNASSAIELWAHPPDLHLGPEATGWRPILPRQDIQPDTIHLFELADDQPTGWVRLDAFPDGGLARLRLVGSVEPGARRQAGYRWFNALPDDQAVACLEATGVPPGAAAAALVGARPLTPPLRGARADTNPSGALQALAGILGDPR